MSTLERAIAIAAEAHEGQVDKAGAPYILHPLRVMLRVTTMEERIAAVLHDVVEDGTHKGWTLDRLRDEGFNSAIVDAVKALTKRPEEQNDYEAFIHRAAANLIALRVKLEDLHDNCDLSRIAHPTQNDYARIQKYRRAIAYIEKVEAKGD